MDGQVSWLGTVHPYSHFKLLWHTDSSSSCCVVFFSSLILRTKPIGDGAMDDGAGSG